MKTLMLSLALSLVLVGCTSEAEKRAQTEQAQRAEALRLEKEAAAIAHAQAEQAQRTEAEGKRALLANPAAYFEATDARFFDKGIIHRYRELVGVSLMNKSKFAVRDIRGAVQWLSDNGNEIASVNFAVSGTIPASDMKTFAKKDGTLSTATIQTPAKKYRLSVTHVALVSP